MCQYCGSNLPCDCSIVRQPYCNNCLQDTTCDSKINAKCIFYHLDDNVTSKLTCLQLGNKIDLETILEKIDSKICSFQSIQTPLSVVNSNSINLVSSGVAGHTLTANTKVSSQTENTVVVNNDGIFSSVKVVSGNCITFTKTVVNGQIIYTPELDINCIATLVCAICSPASCSSASNIHFS